MSKKLIIKILEKVNLGMNDNIYNAEDILEVYELNHFPTAIVNSRI